MRVASLLLFALALAPAPLVAQVVRQDTTAGLTFQENFSVPLSRAQAFDAALLAWQRSFGREPSARIALQDREAGLLEGTARLNFRATQLVGREETMGVIQYRVVVQAHNGGCTVQVTNLRHTGNRAAQNGGLDLGLLLNGDPTPGARDGYSHRSIKQLSIDMKKQCATRMNALMNGFGSTLRTAIEP